MIQDQIQHLIAQRVREDGLTETGIAGVKLFRAIQPIPCAPAIYEPSVIAIVSGAKEAVLDAQRYVYDNDRYLCCPISMPVTAGTPAASPDNPLYGVYIALDPGVMTELVMKMETTDSPAPAARGDLIGPVIGLARWDAAFSDALLRLLQLGDSGQDMAVLAEARLRELYYAILTGEAGDLARQAFGVGSAIARVIAYMSSNLSKTHSIDDMATRAGMSRAVFHRRFKQATMMSPVQFVKSMRLNHAAMNIARGMAVNEAALDVGYVSPSQFSREFKRMYGQSPRRWSDAQRLPEAMA